MGEVAEMVYDGILCESCGVYIGSPTGHPRTCIDCRPKSKKKKKK